MFSSIRPQIEQLIAQAETGRALQILLSFTDQASLQDSLFRSQALALSARYAYLQDQQIKGVLSLDEYHTEVAKVREGILSIVRQGGKPVTNVKSTVIKAGVVLLLLAAIGFGWWKMNETPGKTQAQLPDNPTTESIKKDPEPVKKEEPGISKQDQASGVKTQTAGKSSQGQSPAKPAKPDPVPPATATEFITVLITIDACWRGAHVLVDGRETGILEGTRSEVEIPLKNSPSNIKLLKDGAESPSKFKTLKNHDSITFTCN